jgi:antirestriction protein
VIVSEHEPQPDDNEGEKTPEREATTPPRIYVASLADYNAGRLHGVWINANQEVEAIDQAIQEMLRQSIDPGAEEWAIHDYEGFGPLRLEEFEWLDYISRVASGIVEHGLAYAAWAVSVGVDRGSLDLFEDCYIGHWNSVEHYARESLKDLGFLDENDQHLPPYLRNYVHFDFKGFARDLTLGGDVVAIDSPEGGVWLFDCR